MARRRILFVGMVNSPHAARWIELISDRGWDLHFFPVYQAAPHPLMRNITIHKPWLRLRPGQMAATLFNDPVNAFNLRKMDRDGHPNGIPVRAVYPFIPVIGPIENRLSRVQTPPLGESEITAPVAYGPRVLATLIRQLEPDLIHSLEFQHAGYLTLSARDRMGRADFPKWYATNWGSDIYFYRNFPNHREQIARLLRSLDYYSCECRRDIELARELGLTGEVMPVLPNTGGFDIPEIEHYRSSIAPSERRVVMVKGYQSFAGRALTALEAVLRCKDVLAGYRVVVFSAGEGGEVAERVEELRVFHGLDISALPYVSHARMLRYFAHSRVYLGVGVSDGISTSMLEAMAMGAFPIQTNTSCCDEWIVDGKTGYSVPPDNVAVIADRLRSALTDDRLVDAATDANWETVRTRLDKEKLRPQVVGLYDSIFGQSLVAA